MVVGVVRCGAVSCRVVWLFGGGDGGACVCVRVCLHVCVHAYCDANMGLRTETLVIRLVFVYLFIRLFIYHVPPISIAN